MNNTIAAIILIVIIALAGWLYLYKPASQTTGNTIPTESLATPAGVMLTYASTTWALATTPSQVLVHSYIPPCDQNFDYCFYYNGTDYANTNFESAGLRVKQRSDLKSERVCLQTPPEGYDAKVVPTATSSAETYSTSVFAPIGDAAAGHYAAGALYRLFIRTNTSCTEFEERLGETQYANYPAGSITEFTTADYARVFGMLDDLVAHVSLTSGEHVTFAQATSTTPVGQ